MNSIIIQYKKAALAFGAVIVMGASTLVRAECKPCAAAAAIKQSIKDAQAASLAVEKPSAKPVAKPNKPARSQEIDAASICCEFCAQNGYCMSNICNTCKSRELQISLVEVATAALAAASELAQAQELDVVPGDENQERAPREALQDICPEFPADDSIDAKLQALFNCCVCANQQIRCQTKLNEKCCKKLRHRIDEVNDNIGDPDATSIAIPACSVVASIVDVIDSTDVDVMTWLKSLYVLLFQVYQCACHPCIEG